MSLKFEPTGNPYQWAAESAIPNIEWLIGCNCEGTFTVRKMRVSDTKELAVLAKASLLEAKNYCIQREARELEVLSKQTEDLYPLKEVPSAFQQGPAVMQSGPGTMQEMAQGQIALISAMKDLEDSLDKLRSVVLNVYNQNNAMLAQSEEQLRIWQKWDAAQK